MNPVAAICHVLAIVLGVFGGIWAVNSLSPDLPDEDVEPGVEIPVPVGPESPESLFQPGPLSTAISQLEGQEGDGVEYAFISITPTSLVVSDITVDGGVEPSDISTGEPQRVIDLLSAERKEISQDDARQMDLVATSDGLVWVVHLDSSSVSAPTQYVVPYGTDEVQADAPLPDAVLP